MQGDMFLWEKHTDTVESFVTPLSRMGSESVKADPLSFHGMIRMHVPVACISCALPTLALTVRNLATDSVGDPSSGWTEVHLHACIPSRLHVCVVHVLIRYDIAAVVVPNIAMC